MRNKSLLICLGILCALALAPARVPAASPDETYTHKAGGIQFDLPDGWQAEEDEGLLTVSAPDESIAVVFWVTGATEFEAAAEALDEELAKQIKNLRFDGEPKEGEHNGMLYASVTGNGQIDGNNVAFSADLVMARKPVIILTFASPENFRRHAGSYRKLIGSVRKV